jgi:hypothetical protein
VTAERRGVGVIGSALLAQVADKLELAKALSLRLAVRNSVGVAMPRAA